MLLLVADTLVRRRAVVEELARLGVALGVAAGRGVLELRPTLDGTHLVTLPVCFAIPSSYEQPEVEPQDSQT